MCLPATSDNDSYKTTGNSSQQPVKLAEFNCTTPHQVNIFSFIHLIIRSNQFMAKQLYHHNSFPTHYQFD